MKASQGVMYSVLTLPGNSKRKSCDGVGVKSSKIGEFSGGIKKVRRSFKQPSEQENIFVYIQQE